MLVKCVAVSALLCVDSRLSSSLAMVLSECVEFASSVVQSIYAIVKAVLILVYDSHTPRASTSTAVQGIGLQTPLPAKLPSVVDIKKALPKQCFERRLKTSLYYAVRDVVQVVITFAVFYSLINLTSSTLLRATLVVLYWAVQGTFFTAVFVIGHDCGHGSFSDYPLLNNVVGTLMHGFLWCPYYMWKLTHRCHHKHNANIDKDEVFYPVRESEPHAGDKTLPGFGFGLGWFGYLLFGYNPRPVNHFNPCHSMFVGHVVGCTCSLGCLALMTYVLYQFYAVCGLASLVIYYVVPDFIFASYCVIITFLHHNEMNLPWFSDTEWDFVRGQLSTVDRHYGIVHNVIHSISTHQMHHMFSLIPHYRLELATKHFRAAFPELVRTCDEPILPSFVRMYFKFEKQSVIADDTKVHYYK